MDNMFCYQCEQAAKGTGCSAMGVCGKTPEVAGLQDLLVYAVKGVSFWANLALAYQLTWRRRVGEAEGAVAALDQIAHRDQVNRPAALELRTVSV